MGVDYIEIFSNERYADFQNDAAVHIKLTPIAAIETTLIGFFAMWPTCVCRYEHAVKQSTRELLGGFRL